MAGFRVKVGQVWRSKQGGWRIEITRRVSGNGHWKSRKLNGGKSHKINEHTLLKLFELEGS